MKKFITLTIALAVVLFVFSMTSFAVTAVQTSSTVIINGRYQAFEAYNINDNNYFKLRDLAFMLDGSEKSFDVGWDSVANAISLKSGQRYTTVGGELTVKGSGSKNATPTDSRITLDGKGVTFMAYNIEGNNYFKLRDIGEAFNFAVEWDGARDTIIIDTSKAYAANGTATPTEQPTESFVPDVYSGMTYIPSIPAYISIPEGYDIFFQDNQGNQEALKRKNVTKEQMDKFMQLSGEDVLVLPKDATDIINSTWEITVRVKAGAMYQELGDFNSLSRPALEQYSEELTSSFMGNSGYQLFETEETIFCVFDWNPPRVNHQQRYASIVNEKMVYIWFSRPNGELTDDDRAMLREIVSSLKIVE
jgi:hypothetical protein